MGNEYVGQQARVIIPLHRSVDVSDAVTAEMRATAHDALESMMAEHGCTPTDLSLLWVKPLDHVDPELLGPLADSKVGYIDFWMYEATAA